MVVDAAQWRKDKAERIARGETKHSVPVDAPAPPPPAEVGAFADIPLEIVQPEVAIEEPPPRPAHRVHRKKE